MEILSNRSCCQAPVANGSYTASETHMASISQRQSLDMELMTAEGDKVTLSYDAYASAMYAESVQVESKDGSLGVQWSELSAGKHERELSISVEGDLNRQEQRDIRKAIKTIGRMLKKFVQGRVKPMMAKAAQLSGLKTIAGLDVSMAYERQVITARQTDVALTYDYNADVVSRPLLHDTAGISDPDPLGTEITTLAREMADVVRATQAPRENVLKAAESMLAQHRKAAGRDSSTADLFDRIRDRFKAMMEDSEASKAV